MGLSTADKNKAENEVVFRDLNEQMQKNIDTLARIAKEESQYAFVPDLQRTIHFYCECSDENCTMRIRIKPSILAKLHTKDNCFVVIPGHALAEIERVVQRRSNYEVVEKFITPPKKKARLHRTNVENV